MPLFHTDNAILPIDGVTQGFRKYWKLEKMLPKEELSTVQQFLHTKHYAWLCHFSFADLDHFQKFHVSRSSEWFETEVIDIKRDTEFDVRLGIVRKSGKEIVSSDVQVLSPKKNAAVFRLIRRSELRKVMHAYKELELFVMINEKNEEREDKNTSYMEKFRMDYKELLLSGRNSDFTINVKGVKFDVHRSIVGARSPVFSAMMEHDMAEKRSGEVTLVDADPAVFRLFLLYLYTGDEQHLDGKNIAELYTLGDKYCVEDLRLLCVERMKAHLSVDNFFQVFYISQQLPPHSELSEIVTQFFLEDSKEIIGSEKYHEFVKEHPEEARVLMKVLEAVE